VRAVLPEVGSIERVRLWLRFQRYGLLLVGAPLVAVVVAVRAMPWWVAMFVGIVGLAPARFGVEVLSRWPKKLRALRIGIARIRAQRFTVTSIKPYCGDPCFRVVADELLRRAGEPRAARRDAIRRYANDLREQERMLVLVDHVRGTVPTIGGNAREEI